MSVEGFEAVVIISPPWEEVLQSRLGSAASVFWISGIYSAHLPRFLAVVAANVETKRNAALEQKNCQNFQALWITSPSLRSRARFGSAGVPVCPSAGWVTSATGGLALLPSVWFLCVSTAQSVQWEKPLPVLQELQSEEVARLIIQVHYCSRCKGLWADLLVIFWHAGWLAPGVQKGRCHPNKCLSSALYDPEILASRVSLESCLVK